MQKIAKIAVALVAIAVLWGTTGAARAMPTVSDVSMAQISGTRQVQINYTLTGEDAIMTLSIETNGVVIPESAMTRLYGDVNQVVAAGEGSKSITWNAGVDWPEHFVTNARALVTAWCTNTPPQVMVIDLGGGPLTNSYPVAYYTSTEALPGGVTNTIYKSSYLVMRKITQGEYNMGEGTCAVTLTHDFYVGVFQVTQGQWAQVMGSWPAYFTDVSSRVFRPVEQVSYHDIRENPDDNQPLDPNWPQSDEVGPNSFMGLLRTRTGLSGFDLPTEAQWEYACRAGTTTYYNDGIAGTPNTTSNAQIDVLGRYTSNGGAENGTAIVGSYIPNTWGLYDMHGNVREFCLDWFVSSLPGGDDPRGAEKEYDVGFGRVNHGGSWNRAASNCRSADRNEHLPSTRSSGVGFRLVRTLP